MKRILFLITLSMFFVLFGCGSKDSTNEVEISKNALNNVNKEGMPIVDKSTTLDFFAERSPTTAKNWNDIMIFNEYEKSTNLDINWEMVPSESLEEKRNLALASGTLPDAFYGSRMPAADILKYGKQGVLIPLNDLIDKYAPNFKQVLKDNPEVEKALTFPDGNIYSFPQVAESDFLSYRIGAKPWIREDWLQELGMEIPKTTAEFYAYLKAVKAEDPGDNEGIPYGAPRIDELIYYLYGSFGIANKGPANPYIDIEPEEDKLRFFPITKEYREMLEYVNKLYSEELIEQNIFSMDSEQYYANATEGKYGSTNWYNPVSLFGKQSGESFVGMPALEGPQGYKSYSNLAPSTMDIGSFLITNNNENPVATVRWVDHFYEEQGMKEYFMGFEGETYEVNGEGELEFMDHILNSDEGLSFEQEIVKYLTFPGIAYPTVVSEAFYRGSETNPQDLKASETIAPDLVKEPWSAFIYTEEENDKLASFGTDIEKYVVEMRDKFIAGSASFDEWDNYVETIEKMNLEEYMSIKEDAYERYQSN